MARIQVVQEQQYECSFADCQNTRTPSTSVKGSYCSHECAERATGQALLRDVKQDHRFCWSCWRQRKEIERPTDNARRSFGQITDDAVVGFEYHTEHVEMGPHGLECQCGAIDHDLPDWGHRDAGPYHWYLKLVADQLVEDGRRDTTIDLPRFADEYWETSDLALSIGRSLHEPE